MFCRQPQPRHSDSTSSPTRRRILLHRFSLRPYRLDHILQRASALPLPDLNPGTGRAAFFGGTDAPFSAGATPRFASRAAVLGSGKTSLIRAGFLQHRLICHLGVSIFLTSLLR
jgi:hypothetical protein